MGQGVHPQLYPMDGKRFEWILNTRTLILCTLYKDNLNILYFFLHESHAKIWDLRDLQTSNMFKSNTRTWCYVSVTPQELTWTDGILSFYAHVSMTPQEPTGTDGILPLYAHVSMSPQEPTGNDQIHPLYAHISMSL